MVPGESDQRGSVMQSQGGFDDLHQIYTLATFVGPYHIKYSTRNEPPVTETFCTLNWTSTGSDEPILNCDTFQQHGASLLLDRCLQSVTI